MITCTIKHRERALTIDQNYSLREMNGLKHCPIMITKRDDGLG